MTHSISRTMGSRLTAVLAVLGLVAALVVLLPSFSPAAVAAAGTSTLAPGETLVPGQDLRSPNGQFRLALQTDGNLVLYGPDRGNGPVRTDWGTRGRGTTALAMQSDGNLVLYAGSAALWQSQTRTQSTGANRLVVQDDGNVVVYSPTNVAQWHSGTRENWSALKPGEQLRPGESITAADGSFRLLFQADDRNLVVYDRTNRAVWEARTRNLGGDLVRMQTDGNLVVYRGSTALWQSGTSNNPGAAVTMQADGNLVVYRNGAAIWDSMGLSTGLGANPYAASTVTTGWTSRAQWTHDRLREKFPAITSCGGKADGANSGHVAGSYHYDGNGMDCYTGRSGVMPTTTQKADADAAARWLVANNEALKVQQVIWYGQIWTYERRSEGWRPYPDRGSVVLNHFDHIHVSIARPGDGR